MAVQFLNAVRVRLIETHWEYTDEEHEAQWYTEDDYSRFKDETRKKTKSTSAYSRWRRSSSATTTQPLEDITETEENTETEDIAAAEDISKAEDISNAEDSTEITESSRLWGEDSDLRWAANRDIAPPPRQPVRELSILSLRKPIRQLSLLSLKIPIRKAIKRNSLPPRTPIRQSSLTKLKKLLPPRKPIRELSLTKPIRQ